jgi:hypothetical protein
MTREGARGRARAPKRRAGTPAARPSARPPAAGRGGGTVRVREIDSLREELERRAAALTPARWNADPEEVQRSVARLVLTLIEFLRQLFEKQTIRRMEEGTLTAGETEKLGVALMRLEETVRDLAGRFGLTPEELNLDLGPLGRLR